MREFILRARKGPTTANFPLAAADRPGFLEIVAHTVVNTLFTAGHIRPSVILQIVLDGPSAPPKTVRLESDDLCSLGGFDEVAILAVLQRALHQGRNCCTRRCDGSHRIAVREARGQVWLAVSPARLIGQTR